MRLKRHPANPIFEKNPADHWEAGSVLNPNVLYENGIFRMVYRATNDIKTDKAGGYVSSIGYAESKDGIHFKRYPTPLIAPDQEYECSLGCEDPRVSEIDGQYFLYYTAVAGMGTERDARIALATSKDFQKFIKHGIVGPQYTTSKAAVLFPEKVSNQYVVFYTWRSDTPTSSIIQARFDRLEDVIKPPNGFMADNIDHYNENVVFDPPLKVYRGAEVGAVPIKTDSGWLFIYCNANVSNHAEWTISAALLDLQDPGHILAETEEPILRPETEGEKNGVINNVTFPSGAVVVGEELYVYYGSGDQGCCLATCNLNELLEYLKSH